MKATFLLIAILLAGTITVNFTFERVKKAPNGATVEPKLIGARPVITSPALANLTAYTLTAFVEGWNSSATGLICSPSGRAGCNPGMVMFRG